MRIYLGIMPDRDDQECRIEVHRNVGDKEKPVMEHIGTIPIGVTHISQVFEIQEGDLFRFITVKD